MASPVPGGIEIRLTTRPFGPTVFVQGPSIARFTARSWSSQKVDYQPRSWAKHALGLPFPAEPRCRRSTPRPCGHRHQTPGSPARDVPDPYSRTENSANRVPPRRPSPTCNHAGCTSRRARHRHWHRLQAGRAEGPRGDRCSTSWPRAKVGNATDPIAIIPSSQARGETAQIVSRLGLSFSSLASLTLVASRHRHEQSRPQLSIDQLTVFLDHQVNHLVVSVADRNHQPAAFLELLNQRSGHFRREHR